MPLRLTRTGGCLQTAPLQILEGTPFNYEGEVLEDCTGAFGFRGDGLVIATSEGISPTSAQPPGIAHFLSITSFTRRIFPSSFITAARTSIFGYAIGLFQQNGIRNVIG